MDSNFYFINYYLCVQGHQNFDSSLDISGSAPSYSTAASQTDLTGEVKVHLEAYKIIFFIKTCCFLKMLPVGARLAEMARLRLRYDDARRQVQEIQQVSLNIE